MNLLRAALVFAICGALPLDAVAADRHTDECASGDPAPLLRQGCAVLDGFLATFNARDADAWAATLNFPHVRLAADTVQVWDTPSDYARSNDVRDLAKGGWAYTRWDWRQLVQSSDDKLHFLVQFTRYGRDDKLIGSYESLYILTRKDGHWGVQARSSYAGIVRKGSAY